MARNGIISGRASNVHIIEDNEKRIVKKTFHPKRIPRIVNYLVLKSKHPLSTEKGIELAYWKRRLAHRLCEYGVEGIEVNDAIELYEDGFTSLYIEGKRLSPVPLPHEKDARSKLYSLENYFNSIGMPTWSFRRLNPLRYENIILTEAGPVVIDYESAFPFWNSNGVFGYEEIDFESLGRYLLREKKHINKVLGSEESEKLYEAFEESKCAQTILKSEQEPRKLKGVLDCRRFVNRNEMENALYRLYENGAIEDGKFNELLEKINTKEMESLIRHCMFHLSAHCGIWCLTHFVIPVPVIGSMILRPTYTIFMRGVYEVIFRDKRNIHSPTVVLASLVPFAGNFSYAIPLLKENEYLAASLVEETLREYGGNMEELPFYKRKILRFYAKQIGIDLQKSSGDYI